MPMLPATSRKAAAPPPPPPLLLTPPLLPLKLLLPPNLQQPSPQPPPAAAAVAVPTADAIDESDKRNIKDWAKFEKRMQHEDQKVKQTADARNTLEEFIFSTRDKIGGQYADMLAEEVSAAATSRCIVVSFSRRKARTSSCSPPPRIGFTTRARRRLKTFTRRSWPICATKWSLSSRRVSKMSKPKALESGACCFYKYFAIVVW